ncbi:hypothetical protein BC829DRAFT_81652 [Chytridium lagenaria]|nr:hypothetical protein BC829DRAFT_81652 [Chytridium lagenaria]
MGTERFSTSSEIPVVGTISVVSHPATDGATADSLISPSTEEGSIYIVDDDDEEALKRKTSSRLATIIANVIGSSSDPEAAAAANAIAERITKKEAVDAANAAAAQWRLRWLRMPLNPLQHPNNPPSSSSPPALVYEDPSAIAPSSSNDEMQPPLRLSGSSFGTVNPIDANRPASPPKSPSPTPATPATTLPTNSESTPPMPPPKDAASTPARKTTVSAAAIAGVLRAHAMNAAASSAGRGPLAAPLAPSLPVEKREVPPVEKREAAC